ncbi:senescence/dehydration-associated protein At4g35985, chloroplastic-like [Impatiens glandulifera]|uniref:senescence/dehydration-associated protein At4g35985, chloroplastic-like n=1 Tax=Impatiens glandulifera TaxID=253017 RepID=UPI001FB054F1|nr:senescence/dehydration-associated protein At4g35985, chloroplastic-like [Impatiens glandulifera]
MNCFKSKKRPTKFQTSLKPDMISQPTTITHDVLLSFPHCRVHLLGSGEALEIANGDFSIISLVDEGIVLATIIKVGNDLQWPLTKDEPVVKLDLCDYLFSLPMRDSESLSYGVTFMENNSGRINLGQLDEFLKVNSCFSCSDSSVKMKKGLNWKDYAPKIEDYNNFLAKTIAHGTGQVVKGIFMCSNAYTSQVQRGGQTILTESIDNRNGGSVGGPKKKGDGRSGVNRNLKRVRNLSKMTEKMSKVMLDGVGIVTGSAMAPVVRSGPGKRFLAMVPGQVLLASLDAVNRIIDAAEIAEKQALTATSGAATRMVSRRFGENAGEATGDVLATAGHCANTAWNIFKIRKAINPASNGLLLKNAQPNFNNARKTF